MRTKGGAQPRPLEGTLEIGMLLKTKSGRDAIIFDRATKRTHARTRHTFKVYRLKSLGGKYGEFYLPPIVMHRWWTKQELVKAEIQLKERKDTNERGTEKRDMEHTGLPAKPERRVYGAMQVSSLGPSKVRPRGYGWEIRKGDKATEGKGNLGLAELIRKSRKAKKVKGESVCVKVRSKKPTKAMKR